MGDTSSSKGEPPSPTSTAGPCPGPVSQFQAVLSQLLEQHLHSVPSY